MAIWIVSAICTLLTHGNGDLKVIKFNKWDKKYQISALLILSVICAVIIFNVDLYLICLINLETPNFQENFNIALMSFILGFITLLIFIGILYLITRKKGEDDKS